MCETKTKNKKLLGEKSYAEWSKAGKFLTSNYEKVKYYRKNMASKARQKKIMEKLNRVKKYSILGPQNLGSNWAPGSPWICTAQTHK